jgi:hypothetical protein
MRWPFRRRRHDVGRYVAPAAAPPAPVRRVLDDGVLIARSAVRLTLANELIVSTLRDDAPLDRERLAASARRVLLEIANEKHESAARTERARRIRLSERRRPDDDEQHRRGPQLNRLLALALHAEADDPAVIDGLVEEARQAAWQQLAAEVGRRAEPPEPLAPDRRQEALTGLADDLARLAEERADGGSADPSRRGPSAD